MNLYHPQSHIVIFLLFLIVPHNVVAQEEDQKTNESKETLRRFMLSFYNLFEGYDVAEPSESDQAIADGVQDNTDQPPLLLENYLDEPFNPSDEYDVYPHDDLELAETTTELVETTTTEKPKPKPRGRSRVRGRARGRQKKEPVKPPIKIPKRRQLKCTSNYECYHGQYCDLEEELCYDKGEAKYDEPCQRNGGTM